MPVGVPKVPFRIPGDEDATWVDLYNRLYRERLLFLGQDVDSEISNQIAGMMVYLSIEDKTKDLFLFINSPGGWILPGITIYDMMQSLPPDVHTICMGIAASVASMILVGGEDTKRIALPHARVMIHQPAGYFPDDDDEDDEDDEEDEEDEDDDEEDEDDDDEEDDECRADILMIDSEDIMLLRETLTKIYVERTHVPLWTVIEDMERDVFMSAEEAQAHGIVDLVGLQLF